MNFVSTEGSTFPAGTTEKGVAYPATRNDGRDVIFGDQGNDWLVGGTGRDDLWGGWGTDLLQADDLFGTTDAGTADSAPDTSPNYEDRAYASAGYDILVGNTGGDRLIDWVGEFNSYLVPFAPFGIDTVSRQRAPGLDEFLFALSRADGADPTRWHDTTSGRGRQEHVDDDRDGDVVARGYERGHGRDRHAAGRHRRGLRDGRHGLPDEDGHADVRRRADDRDVRRDDRQRSRARRRPRRSSTTRRG